MAEATQENLVATGTTAGANGTNGHVEEEAEKGHSAHTQSATAKGLSGEMRRSIKVTFLGAGSGFTPRVVSDILQINGSKGGEIALVDIDEDRLTTMTRLISKQIEQMGLSAQWKVGGSTQRREVLPGSHYIVNCIEVSGVDCVRFDNDIPAKYGIDQCIGDTIGPGGLFKALRTVPVFLDVLRDARELCPDVIVLNYTNPMSMMCLAAGRAVPEVAVVGLCHSVQGTSALLAGRAGVPISEMEWECAGINHLAWFTKLRHNGQDLYPKLKELARAELDQAFSEGQPSNPNGKGGYDSSVGDHHSDIVRKDMMLHFGAFITESSGHLSEYLPYYRKRGDVNARYSREGYDGGTSFYANNWPNWRRDADRERMAMVNGEKPIQFDRSWEYASWIIEAREKDVPWRIHGNVMNTDGAGGKLISNLPEDGCVEVACLVDQNGVQPTRYGALPKQMAALCDSNMRTFDLGAQACIEKSKELAIYALMLDPLTSAVCSTDEIRRMTLEMFEAEAAFLPGFE